MFLDKKKSFKKNDTGLLLWWVFLSDDFKLFALERLFCHERIQNKMNLSDMQISRFQLENQKVNMN